MPSSLTCLSSLRCHLSHCVWTGRRSRGRRGLSRTQTQRLRNRKHPEGNSCMSVKRWDHDKCWVMTGNYSLQRWLTSPVRRLSQGKADGQKKPPIRTRRRDNRPELATPLTINAQTVRTHTRSNTVVKAAELKVSLLLQKARKDEGGQSGGEEEPEEESHTPLPPPMQIIKDPNNPEVVMAD